MKKVVIFGFLVSVMDIGVAAPYEKAGRLVEEWYVLPEDRPQYRKPLNEHNGEEIRHREKVAYRRDLEAVDHSIDKILDSIRDTLGETESRTGRCTPPANRPANWNPWYLKNIIMGLGVSGSGTVGIVTSKGEVSTEIYWKRGMANLRSLGINPAGGEDHRERADLVIGDSTTSFEIEAELDPIVRAVMATGRVRNEDRMRRQLVKVARDLQDMMVNVNKYNLASSWDVSGFHLDIEISGSGKVAVGISAGAAVRLRFKWKKTSNIALEKRVTEELKQKRDSLRKLLAATAQDLETIGNEHYQSTGFNLTGFRLGVGLYSKAKFGIVKGKAKIMGYAYYKRRTLATMDAMRNRTSIVLPDSLPLIDLGPAKHHIAYAKSEGVEHEVYSTESGADKVVYYMNRAKFRKGLDQAVMMGARFAGRAKKVQADQWYIYKIKPQFALSMRGAFSLVTLGGTVSFQAEFKR